jgi:hypothetical protein
MNTRASARVGHRALCAWTSRDESHWASQERLWAISGRLTPGGWRTTCLKPSNRISATGRRHGEMATKCPSLGRLHLARVDAMTEPKVEPQVEALAEAVLERDSDVERLRALIRAVVTAGNEPTIIQCHWCGAQSPGHVTGCAWAALAAEAKTVQP